MFTPDGDIDLAYYYMELMKARSERIKWGVIGFFLGAGASILLLLMIP